uniref:23S rRNA methyltransferase/RumA n=1 Tax=Paulinella chromatophora TaxID=39717 RepID=B1X3H7_PAUCH|nr:23S rRNA methyltransferase/RumA [Paulinella chromatophora]ACB42496.1 23S rRNA methyltransferase/RumA [Paulinella chromatophora]
MVLRVGECLKISVFDLTIQGIGVARWQEHVIFVAGLLPGEIGFIQITHINQKVGIGVIINKNVFSKERTQPICMLAKDCGGCSLQSINEQAQVAWKQHYVSETLNRLSGIEVKVLPLLITNEPIKYRNKALIPLEQTSSGWLRAGFYRRASHQIVNMDNCPLLDPRIDTLVEPIKADLETSHWPIDIHSLNGIRHLCLKVGILTNEIIITLVSSHDRMPGISKLAQHWMQRWPQVVGVCLNLQPNLDNVAIGSSTKTIAGRPWLIERFCNLNLRIASDTFFQINTLQAERAVNFLASILNVSTGPKILDAYSGVGTLSLPLAAAGANVLGLELRYSSVIHARLNAKLNSITSARFEHVDVAEALALHLPSSDALIVDPPRKGLELEVIKQIIANPADQTVYLSCNPSTLARDLRLLTLAGNIKVTFIQPIDFFPKTTHVECLTILEIQ